MSKKNSTVGLTLREVYVPRSTPMECSSNKYSKGSVHELTIQAPLNNISEVSTISAVKDDVAV